jgi:hypothetical protein
MQGIAQQPRRNLSPHISPISCSAIARSVGSERRIAPIRRIGTPHRAALLYPDASDRRNAGSERRIPTECRPLHPCSRAVSQCALWSAVLPAARHSVFSSPSRRKPVRYAGYSKWRKPPTVARSTCSLPTCRVNPESVNSPITVR